MHPRRSERPATAKQCECIAHRKEHTASVPRLIVDEPPFPPHAGQPHPREIRIGTIHGTGARPPAGPRDGQAARRILWEINPAESAAARSDPVNIVVVQLAEQLRERGYDVETNVGQSGFRCDLAVRVRGERRYRLGIMIDTDSYYQNTNLLERDVLRPRLLRNFGWNVVLIFTKVWFEDASAVMHALEQRLVRAIAAPD